MTFTDITVFGLPADDHQFSTSHVQCDFPRCVRQVHVSADTSEPVIALWKALDDRNVAINYICVDHWREVPLRDTTILGLAAVRRELDRIPTTQPERTTA